MHFTTPLGKQLVAHWQSKAPLSGDDELELAKACAAQLIHHLISKHAGAEVDSVNWVSVTAACLAIVKQWSAARKLTLYSSGGGVVGGEPALH
ncbi:MAG: hypothetical protein ACREVG_07695 [Burkholderiales bacterium]